MPHAPSQFSDALTEGWINLRIRKGWTIRPEKEPHPLANPKKAKDGR